MKVLGKLGYIVDLANNGKEALEKCSVNNYSVVLMDMLMPVMDGIEATVLIRQTLDHQPAIIAMTANAMAEDKEECYKAGMNDYISKPISIKILIEALKKVARKEI